MYRVRIAGVDVDLRSFCSSGPIVGMGYVQIKMRIAKVTVVIPITYQNNDPKGYPVVGW